MILVTGGTGLVGAHLLYQLSLENTSVVAIHRESSNLDAVKHVFSYYTDDYEILFNKINWKVADINDIPSLKEAFINITHVYHCAAVISFDKKDEKLQKNSSFVTCRCNGIYIVCLWRSFCKRSRRTDRQFG